MNSNLLRQLIRLDPKGRRVRANFYQLPPRQVVGAVNAEICRNGATTIKASFRGFAISAFSCNNAFRGSEIKSNCASTGGVRHSLQYQTARFAASISPCVQAPRQAVVVGQRRPICASIQISVLAGNRCSLTRQPARTLLLRNALDGELSVTLVANR